MRCSQRASMSSSGWRARPTPPSSASAVYCIKGEAMSSILSGVVPYPQDLVEHYRAEGVWGGRTISQELRATAERYPDNLALATPAVRWTYTELAAHVDAIAAGLLRVGLKPGDAVMMQVTNTALGVAAWYGILRAGLVPVCTLAIHRAAEIG